jgi:glycosyltransferase involved in cell wall biosynthesis
MTVPVVVTSGGGSEEIVAESSGGLIVAPGNPDALANAIVELAANASLRERCGSSGREFVCARLTVKRSSATVMTLYHQLTSAAVRQRAASY